MGDVGSTAGKAGWGVTQAVWKDDAGRANLEEWFERFRLKIAAPVESRLLRTRFGESHALCAGPQHGEMVIALHAMRTGSAHLLSELGPLLSRYRVVAPDIPWQSVRGLQQRLPLEDESYGEWLVDLIDALGVPSANVFGVSFGGFVAWKTASLVPERFRKLALLVPAGIANGSHWLGLTKMALPLLRYRIWKNDANLKRFLAPLLTTWDDDWTHYMGETLQHMPLDLRIPPLAKDAELAKLTMPLLVLGAEKDVSFPGRSVVKRIQSVQKDADCEVISACKHCPPTTPEFQTWLGKRLTEFFK